MGGTLQSAAHQTYTHLQRYSKLLKVLMLYGQQKQEVYWVVPWPCTKHHLTDVLLLHQSGVYRKQHCRTKVIPNYVVSAKERPHLQAATAELHR